MTDNKILLENKNDINKYLSKHSISMECFLLGCYSILLYRTGYYDNESVLINKNNKEYVIHVPIKDNTTFLNLLININQKIIGITDNDKEEIIDKSELSYFYYCDDSANIADLKDYTCKSCIHLSLICLNHRNDVYFNFNQKGAMTIFMEDRMKKIIDVFTDNPQIKVKDICIINEAENKLIYKFIRGFKREIPNTCFHQQFETVAKMYPDRTAVIYLDKKITYKELNQKANMVSHYINKNYGVTEGLIGIFMERSIEYIIAILGIMKSGNGYVPIDSDTLNPGHENFPIKRLQFIINETNMPLIISKSLFELNVNKYNSNILCIDDCDLSQYSKRNLNLNITNSNIAYGIYTSGSTGYPKLTIIEHSSIINLLMSIDKYMYSNIKNQNNVIVSVNAPFGFDASVQQLVALLRGYSISIIPENVRKSAVRLVKYIKDSKITVFDCTPSQLNLLLKEKLLVKCSSDLELILVGGEAISNNMWSLLEDEEKIMIYNVYGPTECTVDSTFCLINNTVKDEPHIGRPVDNCSIYILDENYNNVPIGCYGEMYISGYGVARGYYNREELNNIHFLTNKDVYPKTDKLYKTGDIAKFLDNGDICYLRRKDDQVKIRSHRIELNEVRTIINKHEKVVDSLVVVNSDSGYKKLIAYLIMKEDTTLDSIEINRFISQYLPMYMIPNNYVKVSEWPLNKNGKIDKSKLPLPSTEYSQLSESYIAPSTELEKNIADIMAKILKINKIGINDNFMTFGGDSLRVMTLLAYIYNIYNVEIDFIEFFVNPTITNLVKLINKQSN